ncbi:chondroitin sulfate proteoglycan 4 [Discoglossus pictus]
MAGRLRLPVLLLLMVILLGKRTRGQPNEERWDSRLQVKFITTQSTGLLFLAAGESQYLMVELINGTIRTRLERGVGESILTSPSWLALNNFDVHNVDLVVTESQMTLTLDNFTSSMDLPWPPKKLSITHGLFLGGTGASKLSYLHDDIPTFNGCILEAKFGHVDLLNGFHPLAEFNGQQTGCPEDHKPNVAVSFGFPGPQSYVMFPHWDASNKGSIHFILRTSRPGRAPILYQSGPLKTYFYVEIAGGYLQGTLYTGESVAAIQNTVYVSDSQPHRVKISIDGSELQLKVDNSVSRVPINDLGNVWNFHGNLFLGGVDPTTLARMREGPLGHVFIDEMEYRSFTGCLNDLRVNSISMKLHDALISKDVEVGCHDTEYDDYVEYEEVTTTDMTTPIITTTISLLNTTTTSVPTTGIRIQELCMPDPNFPNFTSLLSPQPLTVIRGGSSILEKRHVRPTIELGRVGIRPSQVVFTLIDRAQHGQLELEIPGAEARRKFTLLDVTNHRVSYIHDGSQSQKDQLILEVVVTSGGEIPECLKKGQRFQLTVNVLPVSAPPILVFPKGQTVGILDHGWRILTTDVINVTDLDTSCDQLTFYISGSSSNGHAELQHKPGEAIQEFPCNDLEDSQVVFIHKSGNKAQLTVQASDKTSRSSPATLIFNALDPHVNVVHNSGLVVSQGSYALITPFNFSVVSNAETLGMEILYQLIVKPKFGEVQRLLSEEEWKIAEAFTQNDLDRNRVRYLSTVAEIIGSELSDELVFQIQLGSLVLSNHTFIIKQGKSNDHKVKMTPLRLGMRRKMKLTSKELQVDTMGQDLSPTSITYLINQAPRKGNLQLQGQRLTEGSHFTQKDLQNGRLSYVSMVRNTRETEDYFQFQVMSDVQTSPAYTYKIQIGADPDAPQLTNMLLHVLEGGEESITPDHLFLKSGNSDNFLYEVIDGPQHGTLILKGNPREVGVTEFTNEDIIGGQLYYQHDGSETMEDDIPFVASRQREGSASDTSGEEEEEDEEVVRGVFRVSIQPVNDNPPIQIVDKVFHVVRDGHRLLTTNDIAFSDVDSGRTDAQLVLVRYGVPFGRIVSVDDPSIQVFRFTQEDLRMHRVLYVHTGPDQGSIQLQISDGLHQLTTILEVQASDPFIHIANVTVLKVLLGGQGTLTARSLGLETNLDVRSEEEIKYHISTQPRWGEILKAGELADSFSQHDLNEGLVAYQHSGIGSSKDHFRVTVEVNQVVAEGVVEVLVGTSNPALTLSVTHNEKVYVFQGEAAEIKKEYLMVSADGVFPHDVIYTLTDPPSFGYLVAVSSELSSDGSPSLDSVHIFTQEDINEGRILYLHSATEMLPDLMTLEVSVKGGTPQEIEMHLEILPYYVPLEAAQLKVEEGGISALSTSTLHVPNEYFLGLHLEFSISVSPKRGLIVNAEKQNLTSFSWNELDQKQVFYQHDGSETLEDSFVILANASDINRQSRPVTINVTVRPVNDEVPHVVINTGLQVLESTISNLSSYALRSVDVDSTDVVYTLLPPSNGELLLMGSTSGVLSFTQEQLDQGQVQFRHQGALDGGFFFNVSDGENLSKQHFFHIQAIALNITMKTLKDLTMCPRSIRPITSQHLKAESNEGQVPPTELVYHIEEPPRIGQIIRLTSKEESGITNFTQTEVDTGLIYYQHIESPTPFWMTQDSFSFHVTSPRTVSPRHLLNVTVSFQGPCPQLRTKLWRNTGLQVLEGGSTPIALSVLDASNLLANLSISSLSSHDVVFLITSLPSQGYLTLSGTPLNAQVAHFRQSHLEQGNLLYTHKGLQILEDSFLFKAQLWPKSQVFQESIQDMGTFIISEALNITVIGIPKLPPQISPPRADLLVVPGSFAPLTLDHLSIEAPHISPKKIVYTILEVPEGISLATRINQSVAISHFTQEDLAKLQLLILANLTAASGSIRMSVSDGHQSTLLASLPVKVPAIHNTMLEVPQTSKMTVLTVKHFSSIEGIEKDVVYTVTRQPSYGQLLVGKEPATEFRKQQVEAGEVSYVFTNFASSRDEFGYLARSIEGEEIAGTMAVSVFAMVKTGEKEQWPRGCTVKLETKVLDASELATYTHSVPEFRILRQPRAGRLVRIPMEDSKGESISINGFSQSELEMGLIGVELWEDSQSGQEMKADRIHMELSASQVPPANVTLRFITTPYNASYPYTATLLRIPAQKNNTTQLKLTTGLMSTTSQVATTSLRLTTSVSPITDPVSSTSLESTQAFLPVSSTLPTNLINSDNTTQFMLISTDLWDSTENGTLGTTQDIPSNSSWIMDAPTSPSTTEEGTFLRFVAAHVYSIVLPVCLVLLLLLLGLLLLVYFLRRKKMGRHHVQKAATYYAKPENGAADRQTFRPTQPDIPLRDVDAGQSRNGASAPGQPSSQYWV